MPGALVGLSAVVTGGASGIGYSICAALGRAGANVVVGDLQSTPKPGGYEDRPGMSVVDLLRSEGHQAEFLQTDVSDPESVRALAAMAVSQFGGIDIWVNNAGIVAPPKKFHEFEDSELDAHLNVNTKGVWYGMREAAKQMIVQGKGGSIVNLLSTAALRPHVSQAIYDVSKAAAAQATLCAALELGAHKIRVNAVCPTVVKTALTRGLLEQPEISAWFNATVTLGAPVETQQVADAVLFLAGSTADAITGVLLPVDMGERLGPPGAGELPHI